jgi:hypothetical protein
MSYIQELDAIGRWIKATASLNSMRLVEAPPKVARPIVLWEAPNRRTDRNISRYIYVKRTSQYATLYVKSLDQLGVIMDKLETNLEERVGVLPIYDSMNTQIGLLKAVEIEFNNSENLNVPITVQYEATYSRVQPDPLPAATSVTNKITTGGGSN